MKNCLIILIFFMFCGLNILSAQDYVMHRVEDSIWKSHGNEWQVTVYADLYLDNELVTDPEQINSYYYKWYSNYPGPCGNPEWHDWMPWSDGYGKNVKSADGHVDEEFSVKVSISGNKPSGEYFVVSSRGVCCFKLGEPKLVDVYVKRQDGTDLTTNSFLKHYTNPNWRDLAIPTDELYLTLANSGPEGTIHEYLWINTDIVNNPDEKYHNWDNVENEVINYKCFDILETTDLLTGKLDRIYQSRIETDLISGGSGGEIQFKDPWFPNGEIKGGIPQNKGLDADKITHASPLIIQPTDQDQYKGVFLDQDYNIPGNPYYSVRAPQIQVIPFHGQDITWYFQGWSGTNVNFEYPGQNQTAVVFTNNNAVAQANYKGHLASNTTNATSYNNQRKMVYDEDNSKYHLVYEDNGEIYYTTYDGNNWAEEQRISDGNGGNKSPSISMNWVRNGGRYLAAI